MEIGFLSFVVWQIRERSIPYKEFLPFCSSASTSQEAMGFRKPLSHFLFSLHYLYYKVSGQRLLFDLK